MCLSPLKRTYLVQYNAALPLYYFAVTLLVKPVGGSVAVEYNIILWHHVTPPSHADDALSPLCTWAQHPIAPCAILAACTWPSARTKQIPAVR